MEIWKDIKDFEGLYKISNKGRVLALRKVLYSKHTPPRKIILKQTIMRLCINTGYYSPSIYTKSIK